ncbi:MAG: DEAD/DEAH box helicase, partial [Parcubacteria group bacterium]|nr:DEAD/DEAH box helicase [Parcubacteria group bacterium]
MNQVDLTVPVSRLRGVGPTWQKRLERLGIKTLKDLLWHFPYRYEDFSNVRKIGDLTVGETCSVIATVSKIKIRRTFRKKMFLVEAIFKDDTGALRAVWFNQSYIIRNIPQNALVALAGKVLMDDHGYYFSSPAYEVITRQSHENHAVTLQNLRHTAGLIPIYPETRGFTSRAIRFLLKPLIPLAQRLPDPLPADIRSRLKLSSFREAIKEIHFPSSQDAAKTAKKRFAFEDVFLIQLLLGQLKSTLKHYSAPQILIDLPLIKQLVASLPFELTHAQRKAAWDIVQDMAKPTPMNRLLNGDVGSGKTVVATIAALQAAHAGYQTAFLAPTEILARQHFQKISAMLAQFPVRIALLVAQSTLFAEEGLSGDIKRSTLIDQLAEGKPTITIGTHALLQQNVRFGKLGLVIVDEQHRFGVEQRAKLIRGAATAPHLLSMTATPIPRTLAIGIYGDLDISVLNELPKGRQKIITSITPPAKRGDAHQFIQSEVEKSRQVFVICPRIDPSAHLRVDAEQFGPESFDPE